MSTTKKALGIFCSDLHLSLHPPIWRSNEKHWFDAMLRPIRELQELQERMECDIFFCGDLFHLWYGSAEKGAPELINFAIENLPYMHCIPGQHDLPDHAVAEIQRTAYHTLVNASVIYNLTKPKSFCKGRVSIWPFPFGKKTQSLRTPKDRHCIDVAICHEYAWIAGYGFDKATPATNIAISKHKQQFQGYDFVFCGDNHSAFRHRIYAQGLFINCGAMIRRRSDEKELHPCVWILYDDTTVEDHNLDISKDWFLQASEKQHEEDLKKLDLESFVAELNKLGYDGLDYVQALKEYFEYHKVTTPVQKALMENVPCQS